MDANAKDYARLNKQTETIAKNAADAKKQANNALYETRQGRTIVEGKVAEAKKQANDALYETRQNKSSIENKIAEQRTSFEAKIQQVNAQIAKFTSGVSDTFQKSVNATISKLQSDLAATRSKLETIRPQNPINTSEINANAVAAARAIVNPLQSQVGQLAGTVGSLQGQVAQIPVSASVLAGVCIKVVSSISRISSSIIQIEKDLKEHADNAKRIDQLDRKLDLHLQEYINRKDVVQNTEIFNQVLADFAQHFNVGDKKQIVLALDQAGWHTSKKLEIPQGIHIVEMPSHSPELQPAQRLWPLANEPIANRTFKDLNEVEEILFNRCQQLLKQKDLVRGLTNFYWWPQVTVAA